MPSNFRRRRLVVSPASTIRPPDTIPPHYTFIDPPCASERSATLLWQSVRLNASKSHRLSCRSCTSIEEGTCVFRTIRDESGNLRNGVLVHHTSYRTSDDNGTDELTFIITGSDSEPIADDGLMMPMPELYKLICRIARQRDCSHTTCTRRGPRRLISTASSTWSSSAGGS